MSTGPSFAKQTIRVITPGTKTVHGNSTDDWKNPAGNVPIEGCSVQPTTGSESTDHRDASLAQWQVFIYDIDKGLAITPRDHIKYGALEFQIEGTPLAHVYGLSSDHIQILMNRWEG